MCLPCAYSRLNLSFGFPLIILQGAEEHFITQRDKLNKVIKIRMLATSWHVYYTESCISEFKELDL